MNSRSAAHSTEHLSILYPLYALYTPNHISHTTNYVYAIHANHANRTKPSPVLQGIPVDDLLLTRESEGQMSDLAGNAMTTTVVGACMLSALILMKDELVEHSVKVAAMKAKETVAKAAEAKKAGMGTSTSGTMGKSAAALKVGGAAGAEAAASVVAGADDLRAEELVLCSAVGASEGIGKDGGKKDTEALLSEARRAARLCVCEAQTGTADAISRCEDCGHTACNKCCGRPEHNYRDGTGFSGPRMPPGEFSARLKHALPMRVTLAGLDVDAAIKAAERLAGEDAQLMGSGGAETWAQWRRAVTAVAGAEFLFREVRRADVWTVRYVCPAADEVVLELRVGSALARPEWRVIVNPLAEMDAAPHEIFAHPVARMRLPAGAANLLDGVWQVLAPVRREFAVTFTGAGEKRESWQETLGMAANAKLEVPNKDRREWSVERWSKYEVAYVRGSGGSGDGPGTPDDALDVSGTYELFDKCGAAQASLHKRVSRPGDTSAEMYMFLDPMRNSKGNTDFFVFADNHRRLQYGEHRIPTARVEPGFRPSDAAGPGTFRCFTDGQWISPGTQEVRLQAAATSAATLAVPKDAHALGGKSGGCGAAVAIMKARVPLPAVEAADWPTGEYATLRNDRSHSTFARLAWFTSRLELPKGVQEFVPLYNGPSVAGACVGGGTHDGGHGPGSSCPRCAPQPPALQWTRKVGETKVSAREDPLQAAGYEQALKRRPAPFVVQWRKEEGEATAAAAKGSSKKGKAVVSGGSDEAAEAEAVGDLVIAVNPATLVHRALASVSGGVARERSAAPFLGDGTPAVEWQVVRHDEKEAALVLPPFQLQSNRRDPTFAQPSGWNMKFPLRPEQLRSLGWMVQQERNTVAYTEEEVAEAVLPALGLRMDGRARVDRLVRGGIIADQVGYGKTAITIGAILANEIEWPKAPPTAAAGKNAKPTPAPTPVRAIPTKATLVLAPSQLLRQWWGR